MGYVVTSSILAIAYVPLFVRFLRGWRRRGNPVSLAICATIGFLIYVNVTTSLTTLGFGTWGTTRNLTLAFNAFIVLNFYMSFRWATKRFPDARRGAYSVPPMNVSKPGDE